MKTYFLKHHRGLRVAALFTILAGTTLVIASRPGGKYVAHEWGTFTSVQGGDGVLLDWRPLETSRLPKFVYDWTHPGLDRFPFALFSKGGMTSLQRMETPVIYFYAQEEQSVDVSVDFPQGMITEWYPQTTQIGPASTPTPAAVATADKLLHKAGARPEFTLTSLTDHRASRSSRARWANIHVLPAKENERLNASLLRDQSGSHYFSARDTDASLLQMDSLVRTNPAPEVEKFIFYRGVGNFSTPLRVTTSNDAVTLENTSAEPLEQLFLLGLENGAGNFISIKRLASGEQRTVAFARSKDSSPTKNVSEKLGEAMKQSLVSAGLYPREAAAMVKTWKDSWFEEDGLRVLYILPRTWTDQTLPLKLDPAPRELTRVMVGRAEVLTPASQEYLTLMLRRANEGDASAQEEAVKQLKKLGRFAEPALRLIAKTASPETSQTGWKLLSVVNAPTADKVKVL